MTRSTSSGAGFTNGSTTDNGHAHVDHVDHQSNNGQSSNQQSLGLVKARTMSYTQKLMENGSANNHSDDSESARKLSTGPKPNIKDLTNRQRNWFSSFEKSRTPSTTDKPTSPSSNSSTNGIEPIDSARRSSVKNDSTPSSIAGSISGSVTPPQLPKSLPPDATPTPPSSLNLPRDRRPLSARGSDSIEDYIRNWKKGDPEKGSSSPLPSPGIDSVK